MEKYFLIGFIGLGLLLIASLIMIYKLYMEISVLKKRQKKIKEKLSKANIEDILFHILEEDDDIKGNIIDIKRDLRNIKEKQNKCFDKIKIVRYSATSENEAKLSYSIALTNENADGLIITGLQYRQGCNMYYKQLKEGIPDFELSEEEKIALNRSNVSDVIRLRKK